MSEPIAYLITWTTYGTWLPGDERGWVATGTPGIRPPDPLQQTFAENAMSDDEVVLNPEQREMVEQTVRRHCAIRSWHLHAVNARTNHVHVVVTAGIDPETVMEQFKSWCSRTLSDRLGLPPTRSKNGRKKWWTEHGSTKWINDEKHLENAIRYVLEGQ